MDMPAALVEAIPNINWGAVSSVIEDYQPAISVIRETFTKESLQELLDGNISVSDDVINDALAKQIKNDENVTELRIKSKANGRLEIYANTESIGRIELSGEIEKFVHDKDRSYVVYRIRERALKDHGLMSWIVSRISLSMAQDLFGKIEFPEDIPATIDGNRITIDFTDILDKSNLGTTYLHGQRLLDMFEIQEAVPRDGYIMFKSKVNINDDVKQQLLNILK